MYSVRALHIIETAEWPQQEGNMLEIEQKIDLFWLRYLPTTKFIRTSEVMTRSAILLVVDCANHITAIQPL
jgi:hypothetical protein